jgi:cell division protein FtsZ
MADGLRGLADVVCVDTDSASLQRINNARRLLIGQDALHGFGTGGDAEAAAAAAREASGEIRQLVTGAESVIILAGLGGGTGSGATPVIAAVAKDAGAHTLCIVNMPFEFEGAARQAVAARAREQLRESSDAVADMSNDRMVARAAASATLEQALAKGGALAGGTVRTMAALFGHVSAAQQVAPGDVRAVLSGGAAVLLGEGEASGQAAAAQAAEAALASSLSNYAAIERADRAIVLIESGPELSLSQVAAAMGTVRAKAGDTAALHMGISHSRKLARRVRVTVIAACREPKRRAAVVRSDRAHSRGAADQRVLIPLLA